MLKEKLSAAQSDGQNVVESTVTLHGLRIQKRLRLTAQDFETCCAALTHRFPDPAWEALNRADVAPKRINVSILAGGSARMHYTRKTLSDLFPNDIVLQSLNPAEVVAKGLAIYGRALLGEKVATSWNEKSEQPHPASDQPQTKTTPGAQAIIDYIEAHSKSQALGFVLTLLLGPFGLLYSGWAAAVIMILIFLVSLAAGAIAVIVWFLAIPVSFGVIGSHNKKVRTLATLGVHETQGQRTVKQKSNLVHTLEDSAEKLKSKLKS
ncbi:Heat shock protein 70 [Thiorhodovibrio frisius]|nr:Heat shock protein 70 [Thiorhodovibrio frisius]